MQHTVLPQLDGSIVGIFQHLQSFSKLIALAVIQYLLPTNFTVTAVALGKHLTLYSCWHCFLKCAHTHTHTEIQVLFYYSLSCCVESILCE